MTDFSDVGDFHQKFGLHRSDNDPGPVPVPEGLMDFRVKFMQEELDEFKEGLEEDDEGKMFDALMDLVYVAMGTAHLRGYPWAEGWQRVQAANMAKVRAAKDGSDSKRGSSFDVVKPEGWMPPDIDGVLMRYGFAMDVKARVTCAGCGRRLDDPATTCGPRPGLQHPPGRKHWCSLKGDWI